MRSRRAEWSRSGPEVQYAKGGDLPNEVDEGVNVGGGPDSDRGESDPTDDLVPHDTLRLIPSGGLKPGPSCEMPWQWVRRARVPNGSINLNAPEAIQILAQNQWLTEAPKKVAAGSPGERTGRHALTRSGGRGDGGIGSAVTRWMRHHPERFKAAHKKFPGGLSTAGAGDAARISRNRASGRLHVGEEAADFALQVLGLDG